MTKTSTLIGAAIAVALLFIAGMWFYQKQQGAELAQTAAQNAASLVKVHSPSVGPVDAKVTIVEFLDPSCEACRAYYPLVKSVMADHRGKVRLVLRYAAFHQGSDTVVKILEAAKIQGLYWQSLETVFEYQPIWADHGSPQTERVWEFLKPIGLDIDKARRDMQSPAIAAILAQDMADAAALKVNKTPTFLVNGKPLQVMGEQGLRDLVAQEVRSAYP